jgi:hypothetical protein
MSWRTSQGAGFIATPATTGTIGQLTGPKLQTLMEADAAITVGAVVMLDTGNTTGKLVVTSTAAADHAARGVYEGEGGSGAVTAIAGMKGRAAVDGDPIWITVHGKALAIVGGTTTAVSDRDPLAVDAGIFVAVSAALADGLVAPFVALEAATTGAGLAHEVFIATV